MDTSFIVQLNERSIRMLIDPWLVGSEVDGFALFNKAEHAYKCLSIQDVADVDAIIISLPFSDHCHEETLALLDASIPIYAVKDAYSRILNDSRLKNRSVIQIKSDASVRIGTSDIYLTPIPTSGMLDFVHGGVVIEDAARRILYAPHGLSLHGNTQAIIEKVDQSQKKEWSLCMITCSQYGLPLLLGGTVNLGLSATLPIVRALRPRYLIDIHSEQKITSGLVPILAAPAYQSHFAVSSFFRQNAPHTKVVYAPDLDLISLA